MKDQLKLYKKFFPELTTAELYDLLRIRSEVFVVEQNCVYQDMDYDDQPAIHLWLKDGDRIVALCRVCPAGTHMEAVSIGRVITTEGDAGDPSPAESREPGTKKQPAACRLLFRTPEANRTPIVGTGIRNFIH